MEQESQGGEPFEGESLFLWGDVCITFSIMAVLLVLQFKYIHEDSSSRELPTSCVNSGHYTGS